MNFSVWGMSGTLLTEDPNAIDEGSRRLWRWINAIDATCNRFRSDSEISRINRHHEGRLVVSGIFARALRAALDASHRTGGLCDPTVLPALEALGYDTDYDLVRSRCSFVPGAPVRPQGAEAVHLDDERCTLELEAPVRLDLGATAKAFTADLVADEMAAYGGVVVEIGGDVAVRGSGPDGPWAIGVSDRLDVPANAPRVALAHGGVATSSLTTRTWRAGDEIANHIIDPRTGSFATGPYATASVTAESCVVANAFATAALLWGDEAGYYVAQAGWSGRLVRHDSSVELVGAWPLEVAG